MQHGSDLLETAQQVASLSGVNKCRTAVTITIRKFTKLVPRNQLEELKTKVQRQVEKIDYYAL